MLGIENFISALKFALASPNTIGETYVVADPGMALRLADLIATLRQARGRRPLILPDADRLHRNAAAAVAARPSMGPSRPQFARRCRQARCRRMAAAARYPRRADRNGSGSLAAEIRHGFRQHTVDRLALLTRQALFEHREPAAHRIERRLDRPRGDDAVKCQFPPSALRARTGFPACARRAARR